MSAAAWCWMRRRAPAGVTLTGMAVTHQGTAADDTLTGGSGDDVFVGGGGGDFMH